MLLLQLQHLQKFDKIMLGDVKWMNYSMELVKKIEKNFLLI